MDSDALSEAWSAKSAQDIDQETSRQTNRCNRDVSYTQTCCGQSSAISTISIMTLHRRTFLGHDRDETKKQQRPTAGDATPTISYRNGAPNLVAPLHRTRTPPPNVCTSDARLLIEARSPSSATPTSRGNRAESTSTSTSGFVYSDAPLPWCDVRVPATSCSNGLVHPNSTRRH